jgi:hypothetical protein
MVQADVYSTSHHTPVLMGWQDPSAYPELRLGYGQPSRIKYAQNQSSRGMNALSRIFDDQAVAVCT